MKNKNKISEPTEETASPHDVNQKQQVFELDLPAHLLKQALYQRIDIDNLVRISFSSKEITDTFMKALNDIQEEYPLIFDETQNVYIVSLTLAKYYQIFGNDALNKIILNEFEAPDGKEKEKEKDKDTNDAEYLAMEEIQHMVAQGNSLSLDQYSIIRISFCDTNFEVAKNLNKALIAINMININTPGEPKRLIWNESNNEHIVSMTIEDYAHVMGDAALERLLQENTFVSDINEKGLEGRTKLHWAVYRGDDEEVKQLIIKGCDLSIEDDNGMTALELVKQIQRQLSSGSSFTFFANSEVTLQSQVLEEIEGLLSGKSNLLL